MYYFNFGPKSGYKMNVRFGPDSGLTIGPVSNFGERYIMTS